MRRHGVALVLLFASGFVLLTSFPTTAQQARTDDLRVWSEFAALEKAGRISAQHVRPAYVPAATFLEWLTIMSRKIKAEEWERAPEVYRVGNRVHFVTRLSEEGTSNTFSFTFLLEGDRWFLEHFESIVVRLDKLGSPPISQFPDLEESKKAWMRQEKYWNTMVRVFNALREKSGTQGAYDFFRDGAGYLVEAKTWSPFFEPHKAFIVYMAWEQSRLQGNDVTLEVLTERQARISMDTVFMRLYTQSSHMRTWIDRADYVKIFETIWTDRANAAGWKVAFAHDGARSTLSFTR